MSRYRVMWGAPEARETATRQNDSSLTKACRESQPPLTRPESTAFMETSTSDDVEAFLSALKPFAPTYSFGVIGKTSNGQNIPYVVAARPKMETAASARKSGRPIVYVNGNIHGGEVEGKEAMLAMLRDLACDASPNLLDSLVLVVVPNLNGDGNDKFSAQTTNRPAQNGPKLIGTRSNGRSLDLNRDYINATAPETQASLLAFKEWDPDVYMDLHATNGSYHGYALTYSPPLTPGSPLEAYTRELLETVRSRVRERHGYETFDYGNFDRDRSLLDSIKTGWYTFDARPRFATNYFGLRGRISILAEAYSHDPFERRIASTSAFVTEVLSLIAERRNEIRQKIRAVDDNPVAEVPLRAATPSSPMKVPVLVEVLERPKNAGTLAEPGLPYGIARTGRVLEQVMPVYDRFTAIYTVKRPEGYLIPATDSVVLRLLALHGIETQRIKSGRVFNTVERFTIGNVTYMAPPSMGRRQAQLTGRWDSVSSYTTSTDMIYVSTTQRLGQLAVYLLEPESDDGFVPLNFFDAVLQTGRDVPVIRVLRQ